MPDNVQIQLAEGATEIGLAVMLRDLLVQNLTLSVQCNLKLGFQYTHKGSETV